VTRSEEGRKSKAVLGSLVDGGGLIFRPRILLMPFVFTVYDAAIDRKGFRVVVGNGCVFP
jgi:hypothetical protein